MKRIPSFFHSRSLWIYYLLFFTGSVVLIYQAQNWNFLGDSVNFLCLLSIITGLSIFRWYQIIENSLLITAGYILPLLIRNCIKLSYVEAPSITELMKLGLISGTTTLGIAAGCAALGYIIISGVRLIQRLRRPSTTQNFVED
ncbi:hypothetical protein [Bdellovibrio sp. HCB2-146]|uniref:hypothetical protein n=1 Tax=Bdellovibrio sp. HCB2-146 TaxID=3394362 RepID=UPI0039BCD44C